MSAGARVCVATPDTRHEHTRNIHLNVTTDQVNITSGACFRVFCYLT